MSFLLRTIRKAKWIKIGDVSYQSADDLPADSLGELKTKSNKLSVYHINDNRSNLERVLTALAARRDSVSHIDYTIFDYEHVAGFDLRIENSPGDTADATVDNSWHRDLIHLSAVQLGTIARTIIAGAERERVPEKVIHRWLKRGLEERRLRRKCMKESILSQLENTD